MTDTDLFSLMLKSRHIRYTANTALTAPTAPFTFQYDTEMIM